MRQGSNPDFCPPYEEGTVYTLEDEKGDLVNLEFLGLLIHNEGRYGFFVQVDEEKPVGVSDEVVILEVTELDEEGQPASFEALEDDALSDEVFAAFMEATKDIYTFE
jgi:hypothetical protein